MDPCTVALDELCMKYGACIPSPGLSRDLILSTLESPADAITSTYHCSRVDTNTATTAITNIKLCQDVDEWYNCRGTRKESRVQKVLSCRYPCNVVVLCMATCTLVYFHLLCCIVYTVYDCVTHTAARCRANQSSDGQSTLKSATLA